MIPRRALTLQQPWADKILFDGKRIENRTWKLPDYRIGETLALHAGKQHDYAGGQLLLRYADVAAKVGNGHSTRRMPTLLTMTPGSARMVNQFIGTLVVGGLIQALDKGEKQR